MKPEQKELREERRAICLADGISEEEIQAIFAKYPELYGREE